MLTKTTALPRVLIVNFSTLFKLINGFGFDEFLKLHTLLEIDTFWCDHVSGYVWDSKTVGFSIVAPASWFCEDNHLSDIGKKRFSQLAKKVMGLL